MESLQKSKKWKDIIDFNWLGAHGCFWVTVTHRINGQQHKICPRDKIDAVRSRHKETQCSPHIRFALNTEKNKTKISAEWKLSYTPSAEKYN